jgi:hypothetical protein
LTERSKLIEAELSPYIDEQSAMLAVCSVTSPDHFYNKETGEDEVLIKTLALAQYTEYLLKLGDNELLDLRLSRRLN